MDKSYYEEKFRLRISDFDCHDNILLSSILDFVQDVAGKHADILSVGFDDLIKDNKIWVLVRHRLKIYNYPKLYSTLNVKTWPEEKRRVDFNRDTLITDEDGEIVCKVQSKWVVIDLNTRRLVRPDMVHFATDKFLDQVLFESSFDKLEDFDINGIQPVEITSSFLDLDHNRHVNNINYCKYVLNIIKLSKQEIIDSFEINYIKELRENETIKLYVKRNEKVIFAKALKDEDTIFNLKIELK